MDSNTYLRDSSRTVSTQYHQELVTANEIDFMLQAVLAAGAWADRVKRGLFYGSAFAPRTGGGSTTSSVHKPELADLLHAVLGCVTESAEMAEHLLDVLRGKKALDVVNVVEEIGDIEWYVALALRFTGAQDHGDAWTRNIAKLRARFPDKFTEEAAVTRDLVAERAVLETPIAARLYVASRASLPERGAMWRSLRAAGWPIISSWIDEDGDGQTADFAELWSRISHEVTTATALILYAEPSDIPLKGALVEVGLALAAGIPVFAVLPGIEFEPRSMRPVGSWLAHPGVIMPATLDIALASAAGVAQHQAIMNVVGTEWVDSHAPAERAVLETPADAAFPWKYGSTVHQVLLDERQALLSRKFEGVMDESDWYRLACIRGVLDAIEEGAGHMAAQFTVLEGGGTSLPTALVEIERAAPEALEWDPQP